MPRSVILIFCVFFIFPVYSQNNAANWHFGYNAGIKFTRDTVIALTDGAMVTEEGCASISDSSGQLLFYTNGVYIWNKNHQVMSNGSGLNSHNSSTQTAFIIPKPGNSNLYYVFTVNGESGNPKLGAYVSLVDMSLDSGRGEIIEKNIPLVKRTCEKITAVRHRNRKDYWVLIPVGKSGLVHAFLVSSSGVSFTPVSSTLCGNFTSIGGCLKANVTGTKIASALSQDNQVILADLDPGTGIISNSKIIDSYSPYGVEFSKDGRYLYVGTGGKIIQYDVWDTHNKHINTTAKTVFEGSPGSMQLASDNKIYFTNPSQYLGVIHHPEKRGIQCDA